MGCGEADTKGDAKRRRIVEVARAVFLEKGYGAASMSAIAAAVGGSKGTLYIYFRSKAELFEAVIRQYGEGGHFAAEASDSRPLDAVLTDLGGRMLDFVCQPETLALYRTVIGESGRFPELGEAFFKAGPQDKIARLAALIAQRMAAGELRRADPEIAAHQFFSLCRAVRHQHMLFGLALAPSDADVVSEAKEAARVFLAAYAP
jgi:AcrR family transcriptional regulator